MAVFVADVGGIATVAFFAKDLPEAEDFAADPSFRGELMLLESGGRPVWNEKDEISVRAATDAERVVWEDSRKRTAQDGDLGDSLTDWVVFLVPVSDPTDLDDDDDEL